MAMRIARDIVSALRIKLKSLGNPIQGQANTYGDNAAVVKNTSIPQSTLNEKHNSIHYHILGETVAAKIMQLAKRIRKRITLMRLRNYCTRIESKNYNNSSTITKQ